MILYHSPGTRAFPVLWALEELGFPYELKSLGYGDTLLNPPIDLASMHDRMRS